MIESRRAIPAILMLRLSATLLSLSLGAAATAYGQTTPATKPPGNLASAAANKYHHLIGEWMCNGVPTDVYVILKSNTAYHATDTGTWKVEDGLLTISWENGYRMTIAITQTEPTIIANSYPPGATRSVALKFTKTYTSLPAEREITDTTGRKLAGTILSKTDTNIRFRRAPDGKEFDLSISKLSDEDRKFIASVRNPQALAAKSSIKLEVKTEKIQITNAAGTKTDALDTTATPVFVRGTDMGDGPALVRIIKILENDGKDYKFAEAHTAPASKIEPQSFRQAAHEKISIQWFAEVWQNGKLICKTYNNNRNMEKFPPAKEGRQTVDLLSGRKR